MLNIASILTYGACEYPDKTAVVFQDSRISYRELHERSNQIANALKSLGIGRDDKVALSCPNLPYFPMVYFAILKVGAVVVPLNVLLKRDEIAYHLDDSEAKAYFCFESNKALPMLDEAWSAFNNCDSCSHFFAITADPSAPSPVKNLTTLGMILHEFPTVFEISPTGVNDTAVILYTSGTTGQAKGAELTHNNIMMNAMCIQQLFASNKHDVHLIVLPLFHSFGQVVQMISGLLSGSTLVLMSRFDPTQVLATMEKEEVTLFCGVPTMYWALLNVPDAELKYDLTKIANTLRLGVSGGSAMPVEIMKQFSNKYNIQILEGYGLSETSPVSTFTKMGSEVKPGSVGTPLLGVEIRIVDQDDNPVVQGEVGEVLIRGHNVMTAYFKRAEESKQALRGGWLHTGDLAKLDEQGYLFIVDRLKDMIIRGGYNVYPRELEEVLIQHPAISMAAVVGVNDIENGEEIEAHIVLNEGESTTEEELITWCKIKMASYKYPRKVVFHKSLPMTATGKVLKRVLKS